MNTTKKYYTGHIAVKITCFVLILAAVFAAVNTVYAIGEMYTRTRIDPDVVFSNLPAEEYYNRLYMWELEWSEELIDKFKSEEAILAGDCLEWHEEITIEYIDNDEVFWVPYGNGSGGYWTQNVGDVEQVFSYRYTLVSNDPNNTYYFGSLSSEEDTVEIRAEMEQKAIARQLSYFQNAVHILDESESRVIAFTESYGNARVSYINYFIIIAVCFALALGLLAVLLMGAGRRYSDDRNASGVHFLWVDRPFLDVSFAFLTGWTLLMGLCAYEFISWYERINSFPFDVTAVNVFIAVATVVFAVPILLWLMSFIKRIKAGAFWRHTLVFFALRAIWRFAKWLYTASCGLVKSLWAGVTLTWKVAIISAISFAMLLITAAAAYADSAIMLFLALVFTAAIAFFLLRYANRIHKLEIGAKAVSEGNYDTPVEAGGSELGAIADSINSISKGINAAVDERMKSERLKTELITNVSHDIRTPLTSIITYTDLLKSEGLDCKKAPEYLDILVQKSARLKTLTDDLFEAAKAVSGNIEVNLSELKLASLIEQVLGELDNAVKASKLDMRLNIPEHLTVRADGKLMWRVLENLLGNAFKYSLPGSRVYLDVVPEGTYARIDIKNISAAEMNYDFDPMELAERFKRGDEARADGGSGLGLSIVQSFVSAQGGRFAIYVDGDLFKVSIWLPAN